MSRFNQKCNKNICSEKKVQWNNWKIEMRRKRERQRACPIYVKISWRGNHISPGICSTFLCLQTILDTCCSHGVHMFQLNCCQNKSTSRLFIKHFIFIHNRFSSNLKEITNWEPSQPKSTSKTQSNLCSQ